MLEIDREKYLNSLSKDLIKELIDFFGWAENSSDIKVVILYGSGEKSFVAGADIKEMSKLDYNHDSAKKYSVLGQKLTLKIENLSKPVIAAIHGACVGGGLALVSACDMRFTTTNSFFQIKIAPRTSCTIEKKFIHVNMYW